MTHEPDENFSPCACCMLVSAAESLAVASVDGSSPPPHAVTSKAVDISDASTVILCGKDFGCMGWRSILKVDSHRQASVGIADGTANDGPAGTRKGRD